MPASHDFASFLIPNPDLSSDNLISSHTHDDAVIGSVNADYSNHADHNSHVGSSASSSSTSSHLGLTGSKHISSFLSSDNGPISAGSMLQGLSHSPRPHHNLLTPSSSSTDLVPTHSIGSDPKLNLFLNQNTDVELAHSSNGHAHHVFFHDVSGSPGSAMGAGQLNFYHQPTDSTLPLYGGSLGLHGGLDQDPGSMLSSMFGGGFDPSLYVGAAATAAAHHHHGHLAGHKGMFSSFLSAVSSGPMGMMMNEFQPDPNAFKHFSFGLRDVYTIFKTVFLLFGGLCSKMFGMGLIGYLALQSMQAPRGELPKTYRESALEMLYAQQKEQGMIVDEDDDDDENPRKLPALGGGMPDYRTQHPGPAARPSEVQASVAARGGIAK